MNFINLFTNENGRKRFSAYFGNYYHFESLRDVFAVCWRFYVQIMTVISLHKQQHEMSVCEFFKKFNNSRRLHKQQQSPIFVLIAVTRFPNSNVCNQFHPISLALNALLFHEHFIEFSTRFRTFYVDQ